MPAYRIVDAASLRVLAYAILPGQSDADTWLDDFCSRVPADVPLETLPEIIYVEPF